MGPDTKWRFEAPVSEDSVVRYHIQRVIWKQDGNLALDQK